MDILILGGTGAMGTFLVPILASEGHHIYVTSRRHHPPKDNIVYLQGNAHELAFLTEVLKQKKWGCIVDFMQYSTKEFESRYQLLMQSTTQLVYISSSRVYAASLAKLTEDSPRLLESSKDYHFLKTDDYALAKARQEDILIHSGFPNYTIIRPYMTYFSNRLDLGFYPKELWLKRVMNGHKVLFPRTLLNKRTTLTYGNDVAKGIASIIGKNHAFGRIFHITNNNSLTWKEVLDIYITALQKHGIQCQVELINDDPCYDYINWYDRQYNREFDNSCIREYIDNNNFLNVRRGITECVDKFLQNPSFLNTDWRFYAHWDRILHETTPISLLPNNQAKLLYLLFRYTIPYPILKRLKKII